MSRPRRNKPLLKPQHEIISQALAEGCTKVDAFAKAYPNAGKNTVYSESSSITKKHPEIIQRAIDIVRLSSKSNVPALVKHLENKLTCKRPYGKNNLMADDNANQLEATKTLLKLHGELKDGDTFNDNRSVQFNMDSSLVNSMNSIIERLNGMRTGADYKLGAVVVDVDSSVQSIDQSSQDSSVQLNHSSVQSNDSDRSVQLTRPSQPSQQHKQSVDEVVDEDDANG